MLNVTDLHFDYSGQPVLKGVQFSIENGSLLHLKGQNGAGKTTLLRLLAGLLDPEHGDIQYDGRSIKQDKVNYQRNICYLGHKVGVSQALTVRESCRFDFLPVRSEVDFEPLMERGGLQGLEDANCGLLSVGQRKRVGLLRFYMTEAMVWLLDEPFSALDTKTVTVFIQAINDQLGRGGIVILTSHQPIPMKSGSYQEYGL